MYFDGGLHTLSKLPLLLTTLGRKTGKQRVTPVMYIRDGENYVVTASNAGREKQPTWFVNLQANPQTAIEVDGLTKSMLAHRSDQFTRDEAQRFIA
jgi:deazaflavin-dependent oxidoreductase (nitroreductase family)